jgi:hypothetical protein
VMCWSNFWREDDERRDPKEGIPSSEGGEVEHEEHGNLSCNESIPDPVIVIGVRRGRGEREREGQYLNHKSTSGRSKGLNGIHFSFLHASCLTT